ncbi:uncharacterized protein PHALS_14602 [Plasmopara halstedii]|uniref:Uncharacterized protein n=1 Tax=Plasmopara halstedii TaxID=4781 RepID=A0A0P1AMB1_PLAHL|nr:uncharacterized protein PHALS_14602 [Plasmopara halstedii]CEG42192.1 hypothetical protein PHALS_14602 [Plasmopara halstedii]|eukprot:XP_024578561.1 hypothetical protein PHALS_14602 [Plasmopara halstedii]
MKHLLHRPIKLTQEKRKLLDYAQGLKAIIAELLATFLSTQRKWRRSYTNFDLQGDWVTKGGGYVNTI